MVPSRTHSDSKNQRANPGRWLLGPLEECGSTLRLGRAVTSQSMTPMRSALLVLGPVFSAYYDSPSEAPIAEVESLRLELNLLDELCRGEENDRGQERPRTIDGTEGG